MSRRKREPVADLGAEDYRIVRHTHNVALAVGLMRAKLLAEAEYGCPEGCDLHRWDDTQVQFVATDKVCLHKLDLGKPAQEWIRIVPALPGTFADSEGWSFTYQPTKPHARGAFRAVVFQ